MTTSQNYVLYNSTTDAQYHADTHWGTQSLINTLVTIADEYKTIFPAAPPLYINDMSLPWGGLFDVNHDWRVPHKLHRCGNHADIRKVMIPENNRRKFLEIVCKKLSFYCLKNNHHIIILLPAVKLIG